MTNARATYTLIDLFAGFGGMTRGFVDTGRFTPIYAVESDKDAAVTYAANFGDHVFADLIERVDVFPNAEVIIGGPPCQGFSPLNMLGVGLERRTLWREYLRALRESDPVVFVMENVPELLRSGEYVAFHAAAQGLGFTVEGRILNAADYGVPQTRRRAIVIGSKLGRPVWPAQTHWAPDKVPPGGEPWRTFRWAVSNPTTLPLEPDGRGWHNPRNPRPISLERYGTIPREGEGRFDLARRRPDITRTVGVERRPGRPTSLAGFGGIVPRSPSAPSSTSPRRAAICTPANTARSPCARRPDARRFRAISSFRKTSR